MVDASPIVSHSFAYEHTHWPAIFHTQPCVQSVRCEGGFTNFQSLLLHLGENPKTLGQLYSFSSAVKEPWPLIFSKMERRSLQSFSFVLNMFEQNRRRVFEKPKKAHIYTHTKQEKGGGCRRKNVQYLYNVRRRVTISWLNLHSRGELYAVNAKISPYGAFCFPLMAQNLCSLPSMLMEWENSLPTLYLL